MIVAIIIYIVGVFLMGLLGIAAVTNAGKNPFGKKELFTNTLIALLWPWYTLRMIYEAGRMAGDKSND